MSEKQTEKNPVLFLRFNINLLHIMTEKIITLKIK